MTRDDAHAAGQAIPGRMDLPVENVSDVPTIGGTWRYAQRDASTGRFRPRTPRLAGPLGPPGGTGPGGVDAVTGRFIPGVRNHAVLHDPDGWERVHVVPGYTAFPAISALADDGSYPRHLRAQGGYR